MSARLTDDPTNSAAAIRLADALLRQARVLNHAALPLRAEAALDRVLESNPSDYLARRMRATVYLSQHRFHDAIREAERCRTLRTEPDSSLDGIIGDASLELGDSPSAFAAFDRMLTTRPDAAAYARASYAREWQGDIEGALELMHMAESATSAHDPEAQAWHAAQLGHLYLTAGKIAAARRDYERAKVLFPGYPLSEIGLARADLAIARPGEALVRLARYLEAAPTGEAFALSGDAYVMLNEADKAERAYTLAEAMWTSDTPDPAQLARFQATKDQRAHAIDAARRRAEGAR
jgi:tetratricopeptide (TPR) repeat protein